MSNEVVESASVTSVGGICNELNIKSGDGTVDVTIRPDAIIVQTETLNFRMWLQNGDWHKSFLDPKLEQDLL